MHRLRPSARIRNPLLVFGLLLLAGALGLRAQDPPVRRRLDRLLALPADSARTVVLKELRAAKLDADTLGEYLLSYSEYCDPGLLHSTMRGFRVVLQPRGPDSTRVTFAATRRYWAGEQRCEGESSDRRWIASNEAGAEGRLWRQMRRVALALAGSGGADLPAADPPPRPDPKVVIATTPMIVRLPSPIDVVRELVVDVMLTRYLPPVHMDRYQIESRACRSEARESIHVLLLPEGTGVTRVLVAGERVDIQSDFDLLDLVEGPCDGDATKRTFVVDGDDRPTLLRDIRGIVTALLDAGGTVESGPPPDGGFAERVRELRRAAPIDRGMVALRAPLALVRDEVAAGFGEQRLLPLRAGATRLEWDWCGRDDAAIDELGRDRTELVLGDSDVTMLVMRVRTVVRAQLVPSDSGVTTLVMRVFGAYYPGEEECADAPDPAKSARNRITSHEESKAWARVRAIVERVARLDPDATPVFDLTTR